MNGKNVRGWVPLVEARCMFPINELNVVQVSSKDEARSLLELGKLYKS